MFCAYFDHQAAVRGIRYLTEHVFDFKREIQFVIRHVRQCWLLNRENGSDKPIAKSSYLWKERIAQFDATGCSFKDEPDILEEVSWHTRQGAVHLTFLKRRPRYSRVSPVCIQSRRKISYRCSNSTPADVAGCGKSMVNT